MKKVFVENLPKWEDSRYKGNINWKESIGHKVKFKYGDIEDEVEIIKYEYPVITIKYKGDVFDIATYSFLKCSLGAVLGVFKKDYIYQINEVVKTNKGTIKILEYTRIGKDKKRAYKYICSIDGYVGIISEYDLKKGYGCSACGNKIIRKGIDDIATTHPYLIKYFIFPEDANKYSYASDVRLNFKCPDCDYVKKIQIKTLVKNEGFICPDCGDGKSYPEKFMLETLRQLRLNFKTEYKPKWIKPKRYDFYITSLNCIIETHGEQHYTNSFTHVESRNLIEEQENDKLKERLAKENGIKNYIIIDCRKSDFEYIKQNIINSRLGELSELSQIDWIKCHEFACNSLVKKVSVIWNDGVHSTVDISKIVNIHNSTVRRYLKQGRLLGWNDYDENVARRSGAIKQKIKVICLNTLEIFDSSKEVQEKYSVHKTNVWRLCHEQGNFISVNNKPYVFMYYEEYLKFSKDEIVNKIKYANEMYFKSCIPKQVVCLNTGKIYSSIKEAADENNIIYVGISNCCRKNVQYAGKLENGEKIVWMYYDEYITKSSDDIQEIIENTQDRKVICVTTNKIFNSIGEAENFYTIKGLSSNMYRCLKNGRGHCGTLKDGTKLQWMYYDDYLNGKEVDLNKTKAKKVQCIETEEIFNSVIDLSIQSLDRFKVKLTPTGIARVCRKEREHYKGFHFQYID